MSEYRHVRYQLDGRIALVTIDRPEVLNALNKRAQAEIADIWVRIRDDDEVMVGIVTAVGDRAFCAGADLKDRLREDEPDPLIDRYGPLGEPAIFPREAGVGKPLICAMNGAALGMGAVIALQCDIRVATPSASMGYPLIKVGIFPPRMHEMWLLGPAGLALESLLTGEPISAADAYRVGLVNHLATREELLSKARSLAEKIRENAPLVVQGVKATWDSEPVYGLIRSSRTFSHHVQRIARSEDAKEGPRAFAEKRKPQWRGR